jgi:hypothetical protein
MSLTCLALMGVGVCVALLIAGDAIHVPLLRGRHLPGLGASSWLGGVLLAGAIGAGWCMRRRWRDGLIGSVAATAIVFAGAIALWGVDTVDRLKAARPLARALPENHLFREVRVGALDYFQPSLVFYCRREVYRPTHEVFALEFLRTPLPVYLFLPAQKWEQLKVLAPSARLVARHGDLYEGREIVLVTNEQVK